MSSPYVRPMRAQRRPSLEALRIFEASARLGGFTRAADALGLSQSAVSLRMRDLQADLRVKLFARTRPQLVLTPEGERLAAGVARGLAAIEATLAELTSADRPLRVTVNPTFAARWLTPRLGAFAAESGFTRIELDVSTEVRPMTANGPDLAIRSGRGDWPGVSAVPLLPIERTPMMSPALATRIGDALMPADLLRLPLLRSESWPDWFAAAGVDASRIEYVPEVYPTQDLLAEAAASGAGVALLSPTIFRAALDERRLIAPFDLVLNGPDGHYAVYAPGGPSPAAETFLRWLQAEVGVRRT